MNGLITVIFVDAVVFKYAGLASLKEDHIFVQLFVPESFNTRILALPNNSATPRLSSIFPYGL